VLPSELRVALKVPVAAVATGGTSLRPRKRAVKMLASSSEAAVAVQNAGTSSASNRYFFIVELPFLFQTNCWNLRSETFLKSQREGHCGGGSLPTADATDYAANLLSFFSTKSFVIAIELYSAPRLRKFSGLDPSVPITISV
jgi:hypothetical protein